MFSERDVYWMRHALALAAKGAEHAEVPVGAVLVQDNAIIGEGFNSPIRLRDPSAHAEIIALRQGARTLNNYRLINTTLYVTLEPCLMCAGALVHARIGHLIYGAPDLKAGAIVSQEALLQKKFLNHRINYKGGLCAAECASLLTQFFSQRR
jgi:tRNA(adenine34) deaminase